MTANPAPANTTPASPTPGQLQTLAPGLRCILAPNPSPMTYWGTNTFLVGSGDVAIIDPGPALPAHRTAILAALGPGERISHIFVTHAHLDHSPLARDLAQTTGAPVLAFGTATEGRSDVMQNLADIGGGEGLDHAFAPDIRLQDGDTVRGPDWQLRALHTPGHLSGHLCFAWGTRLFSGDHVMGWASSLISPPDGDMAAYMASLARLAASDWSVIHPAHGPAITAPAARLATLHQHRRSREAAVLAALLPGPATLPALTATVYHDTPAALIPAARRNCFAHLVDLTTRNRITATPTLSPDATFTLI